MAATPPLLHPFWSELFGDHAPVEIEIGCGDGSFLIAAARRFPGTNFLGIEWSPRRARRLADRLQREPLPRVRVLHGDASCVVRHLLPDASVQAYHVYFPDPWPKRRHGERRLFSPAFIAAVARTLRAGGHLRVATDVETYLAETERRLLATEDFEVATADTVTGGLETSFGRKYRVLGRALYTASFVRVTQRAAASKMRST